MRNEKEQITCRQCGHTYTVEEAVIVIIHGRTFLGCPNCGLSNMRRDRL